MKKKLLIILLLATISIICAVFLLRVTTETTLKKIPIV